MSFDKDASSRISPDGTVHDRKRLKELQALPLERKIQITATRITEWYNYWNGNVHVSFSGGKDSTVLLHIVRSLFPEVPAVFINTGLEYLEIQTFAKSFDNVVELRPKMRFDEVIGTYGYPLLSKEIANNIAIARRILFNSNGEFIKKGEYHYEDRFIEYDMNESQKTRMINNTKKMREYFLGKAKYKKNGEDVQSAFNKEIWLPIARDLPVMISNKCCEIMKESVADRYVTQSKTYPILATLAEESLLRRNAWLKAGCNSYFGSIRSTPMMFWNEQDILTYIRIFGLSIAPVYGKVQLVDLNGRTQFCTQYEDDPYNIPKWCKWQCSGCQRTGCLYCGFGAHNEKQESRFERLAHTHPKQYEYCIGGGQWVDNSKYDPTASMEPDEMGWVNWNPKKIWVPSKKGIGLGKVFDMANEIMGQKLWRY